MAFKIKVIRTDEDYREALNSVEILMNKNPEPESEDGEKLSLLATLIHDYESKLFPESLPDPIDAILFRMEQQNLKPIDLIPFIGSRSKVSEILARKRTLTLSMIRALESGLGIPAKVLLQESDEFRNIQNISWDRFPLKEMDKRGYFGTELSKITNLNAAMEKFFQPIGSFAQLSGMLRKTNYRTARPMDKHALFVWSAFVLKKAKQTMCLNTYRHGIVDLPFMQKMIKLSVENNGPILARDLLKKYGIALVIEPHFPQTYLDGATIFIEKNCPIIGLTIRLNHLDNFWFTLMHELAHIVLHYNQETSFFYDDLDNPDKNEQEQKADQLACEALIPENKWENSPAKVIPSPVAAESLAKELGIHTAIVAGRMRREGGRYIYLNSIITQATVRQYFPDVKWSK